MPFTGHVSTVPTVTFLSAFANGNSPVRSASSTPAPDRFIVFITSCQTTAVMSSCSINGVGASVANSGGASFACAYVPTGSTVTATPTFSSGGTSTSSGMAALYAVYGLESPIWRSVNFVSGVGPQSASITIPDYGVIMVPVQFNNDGLSPTLTGATLDFESDNGGGQGLATGHRDASVAATYTISLGGFSISTGYMGLGALR